LHCERKQLQTSPTTATETWRSTCRTMEELESLAYIFVAACIGLSSFKFVQWAPKDASFLHALRFGRSRSFTVIQGRWFWYQSKVCIRLPISRSLWLWS